MIIRVNKEVETETESENENDPLTPFEDDCDDGVEYAMEGELLVARVH